MAAAQLSGGAAFSKGLLDRNSGWSTMKQNTGPFSTQLSGCAGHSVLLMSKKRLRYIDAVGRCSLSTNNSKMLVSSSVFRQRKHFSTVVNHQIRSDCSVPPSDVEESSVTGERNDHLLSEEINL